MNGSRGWDAIVIGAGLGGLTAASTLAAAGLRVLVLEREGHVGGSATTYPRGEFRFPRGPLGFSSPQIVTGALADIGRATGLAFRRVDFQIDAFGKRVPISRSFDKMVHVLSELYPGDEAGIRRFFEDARTTTDELRDAPHQGREPRLDQRLSVASSTWFEGNIESGELRRILGTMGTNEPVFGFPLLAALWHLMCEVGIHYPEEGLDSFCGRFTEGSPGVSGPPSIELGREVASITSSDGRVTGVGMADGSHVAAPAIISNADFKTTFLRLIERRSIPDSWRAAIAAARQTGSVFQVAVGTDLDGLDLEAFSRAGRIIYRRGDPPYPPGPDWTSRVIDPDSLADQEMELALLSLEEPLSAPPGAAVLVIRTAADFAHFARFRPARGERGASYGPYKEKLAAALLSEASRVIGGLSKKIIEMDIATPLTFEERNTRFEGSVAGWAQGWEDARGYSRREFTRTPLGGLYMAGYQAFSHLHLGGVGTAVESGLRAAAAVMEKAGPTEVIALPGPRVT